MKSIKINAFIVILLVSVYISFNAGGYAHDAETRDENKPISSAATDQVQQPSGDLTSFYLEKSYNIPKNAPLKIVNKEASPVLLRGNNGEWDSIDVLNPSVIKKDGKYYNYYSGYDGKVWRTGLAISSDGHQWSKYEKNPILDINQSGWDSSYIAANGSAIVFNGKVLYFYQGGATNSHSAIGVAQSGDTINFSKHETPVLTTGEKHSWDSNGVADPYVIEHNGTLYMYYLGMDEMQVQRLGVAYSTDGLKWVKGVYPIMDVGSKGSFDENGLGEPSVVYNAPYFYMLYTGRASDEKRDIGTAISLDGVNWRKLNSSGLFKDRKNDVWDSAVICDTTLLWDEATGMVKVWYGGGNRPEPAQNLNGNIGGFQLDINQNREMSEFDPNNFPVGEMNSKDVLKGSYDIEGEQGKKSVWVSKNPSISLLRTESKSRELIVNGYVPFSTHKKVNTRLNSLDISIVINGKEIHTEKVSEDKSFQLKLDLTPYKEIINKSDFVDVELKASNEFKPSTAGLGKDERNLSFILNYVGLD